MKGILSRFRRWLHNHGYEKVDAAYPQAVHAASLVSDFLDDNGIDDEAVCEFLHGKAESLGWYSDYESFTGDASWDILNHN